MQTPRFWHKPIGPLALSLSPLGALYGGATALRVRKSHLGFKSACPVICVGNINAGGTGKTPTTIAMAQLLQARGKTPIVVTRGYGGAFDGPIVVDPTHHTADQTGDEPLLLAAFCKTIVAKDRVAGVRMAQDSGADVILLDDGFQSPSVQKDLSIVVVDAKRGFGNGFCIPAGPLREPVQAGMKRADLVLSIGGPKHQGQFRAKWANAIPCPHTKAQVLPLQTGMSWAGSRVLAFAGIAHPDKFFNTLRSMGAKVVVAEGLSDHQPFTTALLARLEAEARLRGLQMVTTEKDAVRLPASFRPKVLALPVRLTFDDQTAIEQQLETLGL